MINNKICHSNMSILKRSFVSKAKFSPRDVIHYLQSSSLNNRKAKEMVLKLATFSTPITTQVHEGFFKITNRNLTILLKAAYNARCLFSPCYSLMSMRKSEWFYLCFLITSSYLPFLRILSLTLSAHVLSRRIITSLIRFMNIHPKLFETPFFFRRSMQEPC